MPMRGLKTPPSELSSRLQQLMLLRVLIVSALLGALVFIYPRHTGAYTGILQTSHFILIVTVYFLTFLYIILFKKMRNLWHLTYFQLFMDTVLVTVVIYTTGGIESFFSFLYILTIISASILLYRRGGLIIASSSSILYGLLLDLHYYGIIVPMGSQAKLYGSDQGAYILFRILAHTAAFYLIAMLSSFLSEQTRKSKDELEAKKVDITKLEIINERIIKSIASGLITVDDNDRIILFNPAAERIFGLTAKETNGRLLSEVLPFLEGRLSSDSSRFNDHRSSSFMDIPFHSRDGRDLFLRLSISPLSLSDGKERGRILVIQDLTDIKRIEKEMQRVEGLAMIGELAAGIAHEIRNPMASISGSIQMLREGIELEKDDINNRLMEIIMREVNRLNHLVNDFLRYARPQKVNMATFDLCELIRDSLALFKNTGGLTDKITVETSLKEPIHLESDPEQVKQILWNLFLNARDAMPTGGTLAIEAKAFRNPEITPSDPRMVELIIRDTGTGFSEKARENLFIPFFTTKEEGSGLGLATVKRIIEGLKGQVYGTNHEEGGAQITIILPAIPSDKEGP